MVMALIGALSHIELVIVLSSIAIQGYMPGTMRRTLNGVVMMGLLKVLFVVCPF